MKAVAVIPARYASTRLPAKPLADIDGEPMIRRVWEAVTAAKGLSAVVVATDDERIADAVRAFGGEVRLTSADCSCGTERVREVALAMDADVYVNVQGDEPLIEAHAIETLVSAFADPDVRVATLCSPISQAQAQSPNQVKVVRDHRGNALYFSRAAIPFLREGGTPAQHFGHIGIYAYRAQVLKDWPLLPASPLEDAEKLEQLRLLQAGVPIRVLEVAPMGAGVDTIEDLRRVQAVFAARRREAVREKLRGVKLIITDVDGVLTDGSLHYGPAGEELKTFNSHDGLGIMLLAKSDVQLAVLSGRDCPALRRRLADLGVQVAVLGHLDKKTAVNGIMERCHVAPERTAIIGDDLPDAEIFGMCGVGVSVANAPDYVKAKAAYVTQKRGGDGALRELVDLVLGLR